MNQVGQNKIGIIIPNADNTFNTSTPLGDARIHGEIITLNVPGSGSRDDNNTGNYLYEGSRHIHHRYTDLGNATSPTPPTNTMSGWQAWLDGIYPIQTSTEFNSQSVEGGATIEMTGGPTATGRWFKRKTNEAIRQLFVSSYRLRNWNLFNLSPATFKPALYVSFYLYTFKSDDTGKYWRFYWYRDLPTSDAKYSTSYYGVKPVGSSFSMRIEWAGDGFPGLYADQISAPIDGRWHRIEFIYDFVNDYHWYTVNGIIQTDESRNYLGRMDGQLGLNSLLRYGLLGNTVDPREENGHYIGWALPVCDFSLKRIELADSPVWANKTQSVMQPVLSWSNDQVQIKYNKGVFKSIAGKHLFYVNGVNATYIQPA